jgi:hypothetical protein
LGSVIAVTSNAGALLSETRYLPFGGVRSDAGTITQTDFSFTGQRALDAQGRLDFLGNPVNIGMVDYKARFYSAALC